MALGSANSEMGTTAIGYTPATQTALTALETSGLRTGDLAYMPEVSQAAGYTFWMLDRDIATSVSANTIIYSKDAAATSGNAGRWFLTNITLA